MEFGKGATSGEAGSLLKGDTLGLILKTGGEESLLRRARDCDYMKYRQTKKSRLEEETTEYNIRGEARTGDERKREGRKESAKKKKN